MATSVDVKFFKVNELPLATQPDSFYVVELDDDTYELYITSRTGTVRSHAAGSGAMIWGAITGDLADQTDLADSLASKQNLSEKGQPNGYAPLDIDGLVPAGNLPAIDPPDPTAWGTIIGDLGDQSDLVSEFATVASALELKQNLSEKGAANGYPNLDIDGIVPIGQIPVADIIATIETVPLKTTFATNNSFNGVTMEDRVAAAGGLTRWDAVYLNASSEWALADANGSGTYPARGLATSSVSAAAVASILIQGTVRFDTWTWTPGQPIYLSGTTGGLTQTVPAVSGDKVQVVGYAITATVAYFDFNSTYLTLT